MVTVAVGMPLPMIGLKATTTLTFLDFKWVAKSNGIDFAADPSKNSVHFGGHHLPMASEAVGSVSSTLGSSASYLTPGFISHTRQAVAGHEGTNWPTAIHPGRGRCGCCQDPKVADNPSDGKCFGGLYGKSRMRYGRSGTVHILALPCV